MDNIRSMVVFCILMQGNGGILNKSPEYIMEKLEACKSEPAPEYLLDDINQAIYKEYVRYWFKYSK